MPTYLTWNVYHGSISSQTPSQRIQEIVALGAQNSVDVICLQEVPQTLLDSNIGFGVPGSGAQIVKDLAKAPGASSYGILQAYRETNPNTPQSTPTADGYLIFCLKATCGTVSGFDYLAPKSFQDLTGAYLRPPVMVNIQIGGTKVTVGNWHADVGAPQVAVALVTLNGAVASPTNPTYILGDFNYPGSLNNAFRGTGINGFANWEDWSGIFPLPTGKKASGLDHILTTQQSKAALANKLNFTSDAYHYPIAISTP